MAETGPRNLISDVGGLLLGNAHDENLRSGVTVLLPEAPLAAAVDIRGGGPGTRETRTLEEGGVVDEIHALVFSGGSAFGLDAATGVQSYLRKQGIGFAVGPARVPIVPQAILFDLLNGGDKDWGKRPPYQELGFAACENASAEFALGNAGAGYGATTQRLKGGLGSASRIWQGVTIGALAAVNAAGNATIGESAQFWAAPFEIGDEFGGAGWPKQWPEMQPDALLKGEAGQNTTLCAVASDAKLSQNALKRLAVMAQAGLARAIYPANTPLDGDIVFALSTGRGPEIAEPLALARLGAVAADTLARAIARGVYEAQTLGDGAPSSYRDVHANS